MRSIERRNLRKAMTQEFLNWAEDYFTDERLNQFQETSIVFQDYKNTLPKVIAENMKPTSFKRKLQFFCEYKDWVFNPQSMLLTKTERERCDIRRKVKGQDRYYFYIDTTKDDNLDTGVILAAFNRSLGDEGESALQEAAELGVPLDEDEKPMF